MPGRRVILEDEKFDADLVSRHGSPTSWRQLRGSHGSHYGSQRASGEGLPLVQHSQRPARTSIPPPPATYQPLPHQLIAVCFNHMAGRQCEHCQQLNNELSPYQREDRSPDSGVTLGQKHGQRNSRVESEEDEKLKDGGEKGGSKGPPKPVGLWDKQLGKLRLEVFGLWARTSEQRLRSH